MNESRFDQGAEELLDLHFGDLPLRLRFGYTESGLEPGPPNGAFVEICDGDEHSTYIFSEAYAGGVEYKERLLVRFHVGEALTIAVEDEKWRRALQAELHSPEGPVWIDIYDVVPVAPTPKARRWWCS